MKKTQIIELLKNIQKSIVSFISISFFVMLGTAIFLGIGWSEEAFKETVNKTANDWGLHDAQITFPYGFEDEFISNLNNSENIDVAEGFYTTEAFFKKGTNKYQAKIISLTETINKPAKILGEVPKKVGEAAFERFWAEKNNVQIGDTIVLEHNDDGEAHALKAIYNSDLDALNNLENTKSGMKDLVTDKFVVTGLFETAAYINEYKITYGVSATTSIPNDCLMYVTKDTFDSDSYLGYPQLVISKESLHKYNIFSDEYKNSFDEYKNTIESEFENYSKTRNDKVVAASLKLKQDANQELIDGEKEIADNEKKINDGLIQIANGRKELADGKKQLEDAQQQINDGYEEYEDGKNQLNESIKQLRDAQTVFNTLYSTVNGYQYFLTYKNTFKADLSNIHEYYTLYEVNIKSETSIQKDYFILEEFSSLHTSLNSPPITDADIFIQYTMTIDKIINNPNFETFDKAINNLNQYVNNLSGDEKTKGFAAINSVKNILNDTKDYLTFSNTALETYFFLKTVDVNKLLEIDTFKKLDDKLKEKGSSLEQLLHEITEKLDEGYTNYTQLAPIIQLVIENVIVPKLDDIKASLDEYKIEIDNAWLQIEQGKQELAKAKKLLKEAEKELEEGWEEYYKNLKLINEKQIELNDGRIKLADARKELEQGKEDIKELNDALDDIKPYDYNLLGRSSNGGIASSLVPSQIMGNVKYTMALLFVLVGVFVCYSALSRTVFEQTVQIGTKKALGLNNSEITIFYLAYAFIAVTIGSILGTLLARFIIEPVIVNILAENYIVGELVYYFDLKTTLLFYGFELFVSLLTTYLACKDILKQKATKLLTGQDQVLGKQRFYEKLKLWDKIPLFTKTIINNCFNDPRRVFATLVGVAGCCSLMVCAIVIQTNMNESLEYQLTKVSKFDTMVYFDPDNENAQSNISTVLENNNIDYVPSLYSSYTLKSPENTYLSAAFISFNTDKIFEFFEVAKDGVRVNTSDGICISKAYAKHYNLDVGDEMRFLDNLGKEHTLPISGIMDFYLLRGQAVMGPQIYEKEFGEAPKENTLLFRRGDYTIEELYSLFDNTDGFISIFDYGTEAADLYSSLTSAMSIIIITFFVLSVILAILVLLNLYVMFVDEKKRELIVLMINGYSRSEAKRYIYEDTIFLTIIGIVIGCVVGAVVGFATIDTFTSDCVIMLKNINIPSYLLCGLLTAILSVGACLIALRKIAKFKLTDINKA